jgi:hypothetical protein
MIKKAVVDRFEENQAVLLMGEEQETLVVLRSSLPAEVKEGDWIKVNIDDDKEYCFTIDHQTTTETKKRMLRKLNNLRKGNDK